MEGDVFFLTELRPGEISEFSLGIDFPFRKEMVDWRDELKRQCGVMRLRDLQREIDIIDEKVISTDEIDEDMDYDW